MQDSMDMTCKRMKREVRKEMSDPPSHSAILKVTPGSETDRFLSNSMNLGRPITYFYKPHDIVGRRYNCDENLIEYELVRLTPIRASDPMIPSPPQPSQPAPLTPIAEEPQSPSEPPLQLKSPFQPPPAPLTSQQVALHRALGKPQHQSAGIVGLSR
jgi:hypothetical protein